jgi:2-oxoglutarate ferredoxin oxidoreductase subunit beta
MNEAAFDTEDEIAWCPGCGNFGILSAVKKALSKTGREPKDILMVSGIGQAAKLPHYIRANCFNGLHGRALPVATGAKIANPKLTVIVTTGDGDCYGEGGNHFIHAIRRNIDITVIVHDNQIYGLTKGQASPTTDQGYKTKVQYDGVITLPFRPLEVALALECGFVARGFAGDIEHLSSLIVEGIAYRGFALIDVLQPCVTYNRKNTYAWYKDRVYNINKRDGYDSSDRLAAFAAVAAKDEKIPIGILFRKETVSYELKAGLLERPALVDRNIDCIDLSKVMQEFA